MTLQLRDVQEEHHPSFVQPMRLVVCVLMRETGVNVKPWSLAVWV